MQSACMWLPGTHSVRQGALQIVEEGKLAHCRGKTAATYQPSMDMGSYVVIINAEKVKVTGNKEQQKMYYRHTGRPGSLKEENFKKLQAVRGAGSSHAPQIAESGADPLSECKACPKSRWAPR